MPMPSRATSCKAEAPLPWLLGLALLAATAPAAAQAAPVVQWREDAPRTYGHQIGDLVERRAAVRVPPGLRLDAASLPVPRPGASVELREACWEAPPWWRPGGESTLLLRYQVLRSPPEPALLELPPVLLRFEGGERPQQLRLDGVPILVSPLVPEPAPERRGFGALQPDVPPPLIDTQALGTRLALESGTALALLGVLAWRRLVVPRRRGLPPFEEAWQGLRRLPDTPQDAAAWRQGLTLLHRALDRSAGQRLFAPGLDAFLLRRPELAPLHADLERFFEQSRAAFFAPGDTPAGDLAWLKALCRRARDLDAARSRAP
ncbi:nonribosomal peptide synthetase MxaA [Azohydromonas aeria]|uniref:nonribosomal peptide synthetase MxaA n=1 Tax=Azohydromonas aeria TaxID=2590212 RepID=UPI0012F97159|nr:nonribosomal peptide synthetase MxaA [Azohydromonas aeria]